ncbi:Hypothetical predicted protein [Olea europaea subsp. europaea]|uniref:Uncharacterized protein n=1 Tax=Olea europaea subsp. europaea TaxID=158383 RepID=A0A8S0S584_OLEEU|nr:Hypothetical predicted protein [Olea europaea subsp. europaea]
MGFHAAITSIKMVFLFSAYTFPSNSSSPAPSPTLPQSLPSLNAIMCGVHDSPLNPHHSSDFGGFQNYFPTHLGGCHFAFNGLHKPRSEGIAGDGGNGGHREGYEVVAIGEELAMGDSDKSRWSHRLGFNLSP